MNNDQKHSALYFALELLIYGVLVTVYLLVIAYFFGDWIFRTYQTSTRLYALLCLLLIIAQGVVLDAITRAVMNTVHPRWN